MLPLLARLLLYASPLLLNGALALLLYVKEKNSHYTQIAEGVGFWVVVLGVGWLLNVGAGVLALLHQHRVLGAVYLVPMLGALVYYLLFMAGIV